MSPSINEIEFVKDKTPFRKKISHPDMQDIINVLEFSPDGNFLIAATACGLFELWSVREEQPRQIIIDRKKLQTFGSILSTVMIPHSSLVAISRVVDKDSENILIWNYITHELKEKFFAPFKVIFMLATNEELTMFSRPSESKNIIQECIMNLSTKIKSPIKNIEYQSFQKITDPLAQLNISFYKKNRWDFGSINVFNNTSKEHIQCLLRIKDIPSLKITKYTISRNGTRAAIALSDGTIHLWRRKES